MKLLVDRMVLVLCAVFVGLTVLTVPLSLRAVPPTPTEVAAAQTRHELHRLKREHRELLEYVEEDLRPWVVQQAHRLAAALPGEVPSFPPLAPVPALSPVPLPTPTPSVDLGPSPSPEPTPEPSPSVCLPIICEGSVGP